MVKTVHWCKEPISTRIEAGQIIYILQWKKFLSDSNNKRELIVFLMIYRKQPINHLRDRLEERILCDIWC